jgi:hypothetical protein
VEYYLGVVVALVAEQLQREPTSFLSHNKEIEIMLRVLIIYPFSKGIVIQYNICVTIS